LFLDEARVPLNVTWQSYGGVSHFAGPVTTIKCYEDNSRIKECVQSPGHGGVLVVDAGASRRCAVLGDMLATHAVDNGWQGLIVYGCVRDTAVLRTLPLGVLALGSTPRKSTRRGEGQVHLPISIANVQIQPEQDYVVADDDGILFLTPSQITEKTVELDRKTKSSGKTTATAAAKSANGPSIMHHSLTSYDPSRNHVHNNVHKDQRRTFGSSNASPPPPTDSWKIVLEDVAAGVLTVEAGLEKLFKSNKRSKNAVDDPTKVLESYATLDHAREKRAGFPEAVFAQGKTPTQVAAILDDMAQHTDPKSSAVILATR
jgi:regulator of ribonuclease activity A